MTVHDRSPRPAAGARRRPIGRNTLIDHILDLTDTTAVLEVVAPCGFGKSTLIAAVADAARSRTVVKATARETAADTVRDLARQLPQPGRLPRDPARAGAILRRRRALLLLDDCAWRQAEIADFFRWTRGCTVLVASERPVLGPRGASLSLSGLDDQAAQRLIEDEIGRRLNHDNTAALARLVRMVKGRPLALRQAAALIADPAAGFDVPRLVEAVQADPRALDRLTSDRLSSLQRHVVLSLALVAGAFLPPTVVALICDIDDAADALAELVRGGTLLAECDRYSLPVCRASQSRLDAADAVSIGHAARVLAAAIQSGDLDGTNDLLDLADAALRLLRLASERGELAAVQRLVHVLEPVLSTIGHLDEAREVLQHYALPRPRLLSRLWSRMRDWLQQTTRVGRALVAVAAVATTIAAVLLGILDVIHPKVALAASSTRLDLGPVRIGEPGAPQVVTIRNEGNSVAPPTRVTVIGELKRVDLQNGCAAVALTAGEQCTIGVTFRPETEGARSGMLIVTAGEVSVRIALTGTGLPANVATGVAPILQLPASPLTVEATGPNGARVVFKAHARDAAGHTLAPLCTPTSGTRMPLGTKVVSCHATDAAGLTTSGSFAVSVADRTAPTISITPTQFEADDAKGKHSPTVTVTAADSVDGQVEATCNDKGPWPVLSIGDHPVHCSASDRTGNQASLTVVLHVVDTTPPVISGLPNRVQVHLGDTVDVSQGRAIDAVDGQVEPGCDYVTPTQIGPHLVVCSASDSRQNSTSHTIFVSVGPKVAGHEPVKPPTPNPPGPVA